MESELQACANIFANWLTDISLGTWLKYLYWAGGLIIVWLAYLTLKARTSQARASFLLQLDIRWANLMEVRVKVRTLKEGVTKQVLSAGHRLDDDARDALLRKAFTQELNSMQKTSRYDYEMYIPLWGFFEIVGLMVDRGYVPLKDVKGLLKGPIEDFDRMFSGHIAERQKEFGMPPGLLEHALSLTKKIK